MPPAATPEVSNDTLVRFLQRELEDIKARYPLSRSLANIVGTQSEQLGVFIEDGDIDEGEAREAIYSIWRDICSNIVEEHPDEDYNENLRAFGKYLQNPSATNTTRLKVLVRQKSHNHKSFEHRLLGLLVLVLAGVAVVAAVFTGRYYTHGKCDFDKVGKIGNVYYRRHTEGNGCVARELAINHASFKRVEHRAQVEGLAWPEVDAGCISYAEGDTWSGYIIAGRNLKKVKEASCNSVVSLSYVWYGNYYHFEKADGDASVNAEPENHVSEVAEKTTANDATDVELIDLDGQVTPESEYDDNETVHEYEPGVDTHGFVEDSVVGEVKAPVAEPEVEPFFEEGFADVVMEVL